MKTIMVSLKCLLVFLILMALGFQTTNASQLNKMENSAEDIVKKLYHDYAWQALGLDLDEPTITGQSLPELENYFSSAIAKLIVEDGECSERTEDICRLDFNIIFASQDSAAFEMQVFPKNNKDEIKVQFKYPSNHEVIKLTYKMTKTNKGWRIKDIYYENEHKSLSEILQ